MSKGKNKGKVLPQSDALAQLLHKESEKLSGVDRRRFMKNAAAFSGAVVAGSAMASNNLPPNTPEWMKKLGLPVNTHPYGQPSPYVAEKIVRRRVPWLTPDSIASISFSPLADIKGIITPNGLVFERDHAGVPTINPDEHRLMIHGMVERPIIFTMEDLMRFPSESRIHFLECPANGGMEIKGPQMGRLQFTHGMNSCCEWTGVPLRYLLEEVGVKPEGKWILAEGADGAAMSRSIPIEKALDDSLVVFAQNGEPLRPENGFPIRLFNPGWEGNTMIKWLRRLEVGNKPYYQREETSKYTDLLYPRREEYKDRRGKAYIFSMEMEAKSVVTFPCPEKPLKGKGKYILEGLAWSGKGRIKAVDVSFDGGVTWQTAQLKGLVLPKAWTRFAIPFNWNGEKLLIQSRAIDETGYVQPTYKQMRDARGTHFIYHNNAIHTWMVKESGEVDSVQIF